MAEKYPRVRSAKQLKPIYTQTFRTSPFPMGSKINLDKKKPIPKKEHQILWTIGETFGEVGDQCDYVSHAELFELHEKGFIRLEFI